MLDGTGSNTTVAAQTKIAAQVKDSAARATTSQDKSIDPIVTNAVEDIKKQTAPGIIATKIDAFMTGKQLSDDQKQEFIATLIPLANTGNETQRKAIAEGLNIVGLSDRSNSDKSALAQTRKAIAGAVADKQIDAQNVSDLLSPGKPGSIENPTGISRLFGDVKNGLFLQTVSGNLISQAKKTGLSDIGITALITATCFANQAAKQGFYGTANEIMNIVSQHNDKSPNLAQHMMELDGNNSQKSNFVSYPGYSALDQLSELCNSVTRGSKNVTETRLNQSDQLFATLVKTGSDGVPGGLSNNFTNSNANESLSRYFDNNITRIVEASETAQTPNTINTKDGKIVTDTKDEYRKFMVRDFFAGVFLQSDNKPFIKDGVWIDPKQSTTKAIKDYVLGQTKSIEEASTAGSREKRIEEFAFLLGSLDAGIKDYTEAAVDLKAAQLDVVATLATFSGDIAVGVGLGATAISGGSSILLGAAASQALGKGTDAALELRLNAIRNDVKKSTEQKAEEISAIMGEYIGKIFNSADGNIPENDDVDDFVDTYRATAYRPRSADKFD